MYLLWAIYLNIFQKVTFVYFALENIKMNLYFLKYCFIFYIIIIHVDYLNHPLNLSILINHSFEIVAF